MQIDHVNERKGVPGCPEHALPWVCRP